MTAADRSPQTQKHVLEAELVRAQDQVEHLEVALRSSRRIGMAIGILMASDKIPEDEALELLRAASQQSNRKLRDVADDVVMTGMLDRAIDARLFGVGRCGSAREY